MVKEIFQDIIVILVKGNVERSNDSFKLKLKRIICILLISFLIVIVLTLFIHLCLLQMNISLESQIGKFISSKGIILSAVFFVLIGPIMEELAFRSGLRYSYSNMTLMGAGISYFGIRNIDFTSYFTGTSNFIFKTTFILFFSLFIYVLLKCFKHLNDHLSVFWSRNPKLIFYLSTILFGFVHFLNFQLSSKYLFLVPLITLPQTMYGIVLGYSRIKYGILYSILLHLATNILFFTPRLLTYVI